MKSKFLWLVGCAVVWSLSVTAALADGATKVGDRQAACQRETQGIKGEQHARALAECLRDGPANGHADGLTAQQRRMKTCNAQARERELRGDERRSFMSTCLKG